MRAPNELQLKTDDLTFATVTGEQLQCSNGGGPFVCNQPITFVPYAQASSCTGTTSIGGFANVTLTGLPLALVTTNYAFGGYFNGPPVGARTYSSFNQVLDVSVGGFCGDHYPTAALALRLCLNPTVETCDGRDTDCSGVIDDVKPDAGNAPDGGCL